MPKGYYIYPDNEPPMNFVGFKPGDPNKAFVRHYRNFLELRFYFEREEGVNKFQANKELIKCSEKLERITKRDGFSYRECAKEIQQAKSEWQVTEIPDRWSKP